MARVVLTQASVVRSRASESDNSPGWSALLRKIYAGIDGIRRLLAHGLSVSCGALPLAPLCSMNFRLASRPSMMMGQSFEDAEDPDDDDAMTDANMPMRDIFPKRVRGLGQADQEQHEPLHQVGDGILDERSDCTCDPVPGVVHSCFAPDEVEIEGNVTRDPCAPFGSPIPLANVRD